MPTWPGHPGGRPGPKRRCWPSLEDLEPRPLLAASVAGPPAIAPPPADYYPEPVPIAPPIGTTAPGSVWAGASFYQYGSDPQEQLWVLVPPDPSGKLDLVVHGGGFHHGHLTGADPFATFDAARGTTVVSIGYRLLTTTPWPGPVDDIAQGIDEGYQVAQTLTGGRIDDVTETGLSAGGTALALINYSPDYPTTTVRPDRLITISAPLETNASSPAKVSFGFRYTDALHWDGIVPKSKVPITLMGTPGDPIAIERGGISTIGEFRDYLQQFQVPVRRYFDPHDPGHHGSVARDLPLYYDVAQALEDAQNFDG